MAPDPVRAALYTRLSGDATLKGLATGGIHHRLAPPGAITPYVVFTRQGGSDLGTFGASTERPLWLVKGVCRGASATKAEEVDARCQLLLHKVRLAIPASRPITVQRHSVFDYGETSDGEQVHHVGWIYRIHT